MPRRAPVLACLLLGVGAYLATGPVAAAKRQQSPCSKAPELVSQGASSKEDYEKAKKIRAQGTVAIVISEDGDVVDAKATRATSREAGELLVKSAKGMKFKPRAGCGPLKATMNFTLSE